jgi:hypothetical protein
MLDLVVSTSDKLVRAPRVSPDDIPLWAARFRPVRWFL